MSLVQSCVDEYAWTDHAPEQYFERDSSGEPPEVAFHKSARVQERAEAVSRGRSYEADELRLYTPLHGENLLFVIHESVITTVLYARRYRLDTSGLRRCSRCGGLSEIVVSNGCSYCSETVRRVQEV